MSDRDEEIVNLPAADAIARLDVSDDGYVHCFLNPRAGMMLGADWKREEAVKLLEQAEAIQETGETAQSMNHGLAAWSGGKWHFFRTKQTEEAR